MSVLTTMPLIFHDGWVDKHKFCTMIAFFAWISRATCFMHQCYSYLLNNIACTLHDTYYQEYTLDTTGCQWNTSDATFSPQSTSVPPLTTQEPMTTENGTA